MMNKVKKLQMKFIKMTLLLQNLQVNHKPQSWINMNDFLKKEDILSKLKINESDLKKMIKEGNFHLQKK